MKNTQHICLKGVLVFGLLSACLAPIPLPRPSASVPVTSPSIIPSIQSSSSLSSLPSVSPSPLPAKPVFTPAPTFPPLNPVPSPYYDNLDDNFISSFKSYPVEVVAGTGEKGFKDGRALQASFTSPQKPCVDPRDGSLYIPDASMLRKLTPDGQVLTVAGSTTQGFQDGPAAEARFKSLKGCVVDKQGNVLVLDTANYRIRELSRDGKNVTTFLGTGQRLHQDGDRTRASFTSLLNDLAFGPTGQLYIRDGFWLELFQDGQLRTLNPHEQFGTDRSALAYFDGNIADGAMLGLTDWIAIDKAGNFLVADEQARMLRRIDNQGNVKTILHNSADASQNFKIIDHIFMPSGAIFDSFRNKFYVLDLISHIYEVDLLGNANLFAGNFPRSSSENKLFSVNNSSMVVGLDKNLYLADSQSNQIKRVLLPPP